MLSKHHEFINRRIAPPETPATCTAPLSVLEAQSFLHIKRQKIITTNCIILQVVTPLRLPHAHQSTYHLLGLRHTEFQVVPVVGLDIVLGDGFDGCFGLVVLTFAPSDDSEEGPALVGVDGRVLEKVGPSGVEMLIPAHLGASFYIK